MREDVTPHEPDAERAVLGCVLAFPDRYADLVGMLDPEDFFSAAHRQIWRALVTLADASAGPDLLTVQAELTRRGVSDIRPGYLFELTDGIPKSTNLPALAGLIREAAIKRGVMATATRVLVQAQQAEADAQTLLAEAEKALRDVAARTVSGGFLSPAQFLAEGVAAVEAVVQTQRRVTGLPTGFADLDALTLGMQPGTLTYLAARPSVGKTAFALNTAWHVAAEQGVVAFFSVEMTRREVFFRLLASVAQVDSHRLQSGYVRDVEYARMSDGLGQIGASQLFVDDSPMVSVTDVRGKARRLQHEQGLALVVIDYLQLLQLPKAENQNLRVSEASRQLKLAARELNVPLLVLCQLSRAVEQRGGERIPMLSDLRDSGSLEQDADLVWFLHRPEMYQRTDENVGQASVIVAKNRNGKIGRVPLAWLADQTRFADAARGGLA